MAVKDFLNRLMERFPDMEMMPLSSQEIEAIVAAHPELPREYIDWLTAFGWGVIGNEEYIFHGGPVDPGDFFDPEQADTLHDVVVIGEDSYGNFLGYRRGVLGEVSACGSWQSLNGTTLIDFLFQRLLTSTSCQRDTEDTGNTGTKNICIINETESDITIQYTPTPEKTRQPVIGKWHWPELLSVLFLALLLGVGMVLFCLDSFTAFALPETPVTDRPPYPPSVVAPGR